MFQRPSSWVTIYLDALTQFPRVVWQIRSDTITLEGTQRVDIHSSSTSAAAFCFDFCALSKQYCPTALLLSTANNISKDPKSRPFAITSFELTKVANGISHSHPAICSCSSRNPQVLRTMPPHISRLLDPNIVVLSSFAASVGRG